MIIKGYFCGILGRLVEGLRRIRVPANLRNREALSDDEIWSKFYKGTDLDRTDVLELWSEIADCLRIDKGRMRPSDSIARDLTLDRVIQPRIEDLTEAATSRARRRNKRIDLGQLETVQDYVNEFCEK